MKKISIIYNLDTRKKINDDVTHNNTGDGGCCSWDFFLDGLINKVNFFGECLIELIVYIDMHQDIRPDVKANLEKATERGIIDKLIIKEHTDERYGVHYNKNNNDLIYAECLAMATGDYVVHFDADVFAYKSPDFELDMYFELLEKYKYVSLPSINSPLCVEKENPIMIDLDYQWASTRFFICKRETLPSLEEMRFCFDNVYLNNKYGHPASPNCIEHILGVIAGKDQVFYPEIELDKYMIMTWSTYHNGTLEQLDKMDYKSIKDYITKTCGNVIGYFDVGSKKIEDKKQ